MSSLIPPFEPQNIIDLKNVERDLLSEDGPTRMRATYRLIFQGEKLREMAEGHKFSLIPSPARNPELLEVSLRITARLSDVITRNLDDVTARFGDEERISCARALGTFGQPNQAAIQSLCSSLCQEPFWGVVVQSASSLIKLCEAASNQDLLTSTNLLSELLPNYYDKLKAKSGQSESRFLSLCDKKFRNAMPDNYSPNPSTPLEERFEKICGLIRAELQPKNLDSSSALAAHQSAAKLRALVGIISNIIMNSAS